MSILGGLIERERRTSTPTWLVNMMLDGERTSSGERVNAKTAMGLAAWFGCVRNIAEDVAKLPLHVYRKVERSRTPIEHPVGYMLNVEPNDEMSAQSFRETLTAHAAGFGNGFAEIVRSGPDGAEMWPIDPTTVLMKREAGRLFYEVRVAGNAPVVLLPDQVLHLHGLSGDGLLGHSISHLAREAVGAAMAAQKFAGAFYANGASVGALLTHPGHLTDQALVHLRQSWKARHGGADQGMSMAILEEGMTYTQLGIEPEKAQFLETRQFGVEEVCRYFRMPPHKVQHLLRATFSNIEQQALEYVGDCLMPWLGRWEQASRLR